ncbi:histidine phosphatase family protein [Ectobacillus ponti]|uniref:Histidine phosphatase family protein n=1 Tax=Ectobacillus ponti TaxID=2961894 RepID=A0AA41X7I4_9BACI|nr:histidine phosphatase family protein [Ectobacillus ponti]MCP8967740.1 histidine phosphatase family protein [Ectobacillus ponti]
MENKISLYLVRHGETYLNRYKRMQGWADSPLTEEGKMVAAETGSRLGDLAFDRVYTSDSGRTVETAEIILRQNQHEVPTITRMKAFRETFFGSFEGEYSEVAWGKVAQDKGYPDFHTLIRSCTPQEVVDAMKQSDPLQHAEGYEEMWARIETGLQEVIAAGGGNVLIVTHGNVIRTLLKQFSEEFDPTVDIKNASVSRLEHCNQAFRVVSYNQ